MAHDNELVREHVRARPFLDEPFRREAIQLPLVRREKQVRGRAGENLPREITRRAKLKHDAQGRVRLLKLGYARGESVGQARRGEDANRLLRRACPACRDYHGEKD